MQQIYVPTRDPMKVVVFFSGGASSLKAMLEDPNHGNLYRVVGAYTDKEGAKGRQLCGENDIPCLHISRGEFYRSKGLDPKEPRSRRKFYEMLTGQLEQFHPDVICLSGYMHIVTAPLLTEYEDRVLNVHPADLAILAGPACERLDVSALSPKEVKKLVAANGLERKFKGENTVFDAIAAGERETRSTIHLATENFDEGPIVVQSKPFPVDTSMRLRALGMSGILEDYRDGLQNLMKTEGDGPAYLEALKIIAHGRLGVEGETLFLEDERHSKLEELPYCGLRLG